MRQLARGMELGAPVDLGRLGWRGSRGSVLVPKMVENLANHFGVEDERNDSKFSSALAEEGVGLEDSSNEICPSFAQGGPLLGVGEGLLGFGQGGQGSHGSELRVL
jgi:hypothetical protein